MWHNAIYEPGEVKVVAYDEHGTAKAEKIIRTAGKPHHIELVSSRQSLTFLHASHSQPMEKIWHT